MQYQNFDLEIIDPQGSRRFCARVLDSPQGDCPFIEVKWPFEAAEESALLAEIYGGLRQRHARPGKVTTTQDFGSRLFDAVFTSDIEHLFRSSVETSARAGKGLRIRLRLPEDSDLHATPWEYLYDTDSREFLAVSENTPLIRYLPVAQPIPPIAVDGPLRILVALSAPTDHPRLDIGREWEILCYALEPSITAGQIELQQVTGRCTFDNLRDSLRHYRAHIFHFVGHGKPGALVLEQESGKGVDMEATHLRSAFRSGALPRLIVLNACSGALAEDAPFSGLAQGFLKQGVPAVVAMQASITDDAALIFTRYFYRELIGSGAVDASLTEARLRMQVNGHPFEWGTPVLYMRALSGQLFQPRAHTSEQEEATQVAPREFTQPPRTETGLEAWSRPREAPRREAEPREPELTQPQPPPPEPSESAPLPRPTPEPMPAERKKPRAHQVKELQRERTEPPRAEPNTIERKKPKESRMKEAVPQQQAAQARQASQPPPQQQAPQSQQLASPPQPPPPLPQPQPQAPVPQPPPQPQSAANPGERKKSRSQQPAEHIPPPRLEPKLNEQKPAPEPVPNAQKPAWRAQPVDETMPFKLEPPPDEQKSPAEASAYPYAPHEAEPGGRLQQLRRYWPLLGVLFLLPVVTAIAYNILSPRKTTPAAPTPSPIMTVAPTKEPTTTPAPTSAPTQASAARIVPDQPGLPTAGAQPGGAAGQSHQPSSQASTDKQSIPAANKTQRAARPATKPATRPPVKKNCNNPDVSERSADCLFQ